MYEKQDAISPALQTVLQTADLNVYGVQIFREEADNKQMVGALDCIYIDMINGFDKKVCSERGYETIIRFVEDCDRNMGGGFIENLAVVYDAAFVEATASVQTLRLVLEKIHCILCRAMDFRFKQTKKFAVCLDLREMAEPTKHIVRAFLQEYKNGDMRKEEIERDLIFFAPHSVSSRRNIAGTMVLV